MNHGSVIIHTEHIVKEPLYNAHIAWHVNDKHKPPTRRHLTFIRFGIGKFFENRYRSPALPAFRKPACGRLTRKNIYIWFTQTNRQHRRQSTVTICCELLKKLTSVHSSREVNKKKKQNKFQREFGRIAILCRLSLYRYISHPIYPIYGTCIVLNVLIGRAMYFDNVNLEFSISRNWRHVEKKKIHTQSNGNLLSFFLSAPKMEFKQSQRIEKKNPSRTYIAALLSLSFDVGVVHKWHVIRTRSVVCNSIIMNRNNIWICFSLPSILFGSLSTTGNGQMCGTLYIHSEYICDRCEFHGSFDVEQFLMISLKLREAHYISHFPVRKCVMAIHLK